MANHYIRRPETAALRWGDVEWLENNTGTTFVKRRKTDRGDLSTRPPISEQTVSALRAIMPVSALVNAEARIPDQPKGPAGGAHRRAGRRLLRKQRAGREGAGSVELGPRHPRADGGGSVEVGRDAGPVHEEERRIIGGSSYRGADRGTPVTLVGVGHSGQPHFQAATDLFAV